MAGPLTQAGAAPEPTEYATLPMDRYMTGLWTQRSPFRDADVPYLYGKFYAASRFDSLWDGINRELNACLELARAPGSTIYNGSGLTRGAYSIAAWDYIQNGVDVTRVIEDCQDGSVHDITAPYSGWSGLATLFTKSVATAHARFAPVNTTLFMADGPDAMKNLTGATTWSASTTVPFGTLISTDFGSVGLMQIALGGLTLPIVASSSDGSFIYIYVNPIDVPLQFANLNRIAMTFSGLSAAAVLNGTSPGVFILSSTIGLLRVPFVTSTWIKTAEPLIASGTTGTGITGTTEPTWVNTQYLITDDGTQQWKCYGSATENWSIATPTRPLDVNPAMGLNCRFWQADTVLAQWYTVLDINGNVQVNQATPGGTTGLSYPNWSPEPFSTVASTQDGSITWLNWGTPGTWSPGTVFGGGLTNGFYSATYVILDTNGNYQLTTNGLGGTSGGSAPTWATSIGTTTTDGGLTWTCIGPGVTIAAESVQYSYSLHGIDGTVTTSAPPLTIQGAIIGPMVVNGNAPLQLFQVAAGFLPIDTQIDQIWIWRTPIGEDALILEDMVPHDDARFSFISFGYNEMGIPDTSSNGQGALNPEIPAPIDDQNDPPPVGMTAPVYHLGRIWYIFKNTVGFSGGPDTVTGNGNTAFPPLNAFNFPERPVRIVPMTVQGGSTIVFGTKNVYLIPGSGTSTDPFGQPQIYMASVGLLGWDALTVVGSTAYLFTSKSKFVSLDPSAGYVEVGFPIGDQFKKVTTAGLNAALYDPINTYVTWHEAESGDTGIYVCDGQQGWFRFSPIASPESGYVWSPRRQFSFGISAIMSIETSPGVSQLLIGPPMGSTSNAILTRDITMFEDLGTAYPSWFTIGSITLCESGQLAEVAHVALKSLPLGARPKVSVLFGEIEATASVPWDEIEITSADPPDLPAPQTVYSDRYAALQNGVAPLCDNFQLKIDYGAQNFGDALLKHSIYGAHHEERRQQ